MFFLRCLKQQKDQLATRLNREGAVEVVDRDVPALSVEILTLLGAGERLTIAELTERTGANRNTVKLRLRELVRAGRIRQYGKARATWYSA